MDLLKKDQILSRCTSEMNKDIIVITAASPSKAKENACGLSKRQPVKKKGSGLKGTATGKLTTQMSAPGSPRRLWSASSSFIFAFYWRDFRVRPRSQSGVTITKIANASDLLSPRRNSLVDKCSGHIWTWPLFMWYLQDWSSPTGYLMIFKCEHRPEIFPPSEAESQTGYRFQTRQRWVS